MLYMYRSIRLGSVSLSLAGLRTEVEYQNDLKHIYKVVHGNLS